MVTDNKCDGAKNNELALFECSVSPYMLGIPANQNSPKYRSTGNI